MLGEISSANSERLHLGDSRGRVKEPTALQTGSLEPIILQTCSLEPIILQTCSLEPPVLQTGSLEPPALQTGSLEPQPFKHVVRGGFRILSRGWRYFNVSTKN